jgi:hypothetical protein
LIPGANSWTFSVIHDFDYTIHGGSDGASPFAGLVLDEAGELYGTTQDGGIYDGGVVFKLRSRPGGASSESILHDFGRSTGYDGGSPEAGLIWDGAGNLYGTTRWGGGYYKNCTAGCGTVFKLVHFPRRLERATVAPLQLGPRRPGRVWSLCSRGLRRGWQSLRNNRSRGEQ